MRFARDNVLNGAGDHKLKSTVASFAHAIIRKSMFYKEIIVLILPFRPIF